MHESCIIIILLRITTLVSLHLYFFLSLSSSSQMAPPSWTVSQGSAPEEEVVEEQQGLTPRIREPRNASMSRTSPSASETLTYGKCLGCVDQSGPAVFFSHFEKKDAVGREKKKLTSAIWRVILNVSKMWCSGRKAKERCFLLLFSSAATMWPNIILHL